MIREILPSDLQCIESIYEIAFQRPEGILNCYYKKYSEYLDFCRNQGYALILEENSKVCGVIIGYETPDMFYGKSLYIEMLAVLPDEQGKGYGKALLKAIENKAKQNGIEVITLRTKCYMDAYMIYNHLGFKDSQDDQRFMMKYIGEKKK